MTLLLFVQFWIAISRPSGKVSGSSPDHAGTPLLKATWPLMSTTTRRYLITKTHMKSSLMQVRRFVSYSNAKVVSVQSGIGAYEVVPNSTGVPSPMARHFAYTFVRDPLILFEEDLVEGAANGTQHCEVRTSAEESYLTLLLPCFCCPLHTV